MTSQQPSPDGTSADHSRSGEDIAEAIEVAERGSSVEEVHDQGTGNKSGEAPVESSGVAQSVPGARATDQVAAGQEPENR